jgi:ubiquinone/menaquinone biosynthesis C-methylase UbiE
VDQPTLVAKHFGSAAQNYLTSSVHALGSDLQQLENLAKELKPKNTLDLGCGAGHASYALAQGGASAIVAYDLLDQMLNIVEKEAQSRGLTQITTQKGSVESLPFPDNSFDLIVTRFSAHHWHDIDAALAETARVLAPGGALIVIDVVTPEIPLFDTVLQTIEILRDPSHVRDYRVSEWNAMLTRAGFSVANHHQWKLPLEFNSWVSRIGTSDERVQALQTVFAALPQEVKDYFSITEDNSFASDAAWIAAYI